MMSRDDKPKPAPAAATAPPGGDGNDKNKGAQSLSEMSGPEINRDQVRSELAAEVGPKAGVAPPVKEQHKTR